MKAKLIFVTLLSGMLLGYVGHGEESIAGIGVAMGIENRTLKIMKVMPNTPASRNGLFSGVVVQKIDGTATDGKRLEECVAMLRGPVGTKVNLELIDTMNSKTNTVELIREKVL